MLRMGEVNEVDHQAMRHMLTSGAIDWHGFGEQIACEADALLGGSAAVSRQWNGHLGKVGNCQVGVFASLCHNDMASLIDTRLYLPQHWVNDPGRCKKAAIPEGCRHYQSKYSNSGKRLLGIMLLILGVMVFAGFDKVLETAALKWLPDWALFI